MRPTYSFQDIKSFIASFELADLQILEQLITEESACYPHYELKAVQKIIEFRMILLIRNELRYDYVLSF